MDTPLPSKEVTCRCGNRFTSQQYSNWCSTCGRQVFYDPKDQIKSKISSVYFTVLIVLVLGFMAYFFIEMILTPALSLVE